MRRRLRDIGDARPELTDTNATTAGDASHRLGKPRRTAVLVSAVLLGLAGFLLGVALTWTTAEAPVSQDLAQVEIGLPAVKV